MLYIVRQCFNIGCLQKVIYLSRFVYAILKLFFSRSSASAMLCVCVSLGEQNLKQRTAYQLNSSSSSGGGEVVKQKHRTIILSSQHYNCLVFVFQLIPMPCFSAVPVRFQFAFRSKHQPWNGKFDKFPLFRPFRLNSRCLCRCSADVWVCVCVEMNLLFVVVQQLTEIHQPQIEYVCIIPWHRPKILNSMRLYVWASVRFVTEPTAFYIKVDD